MCNKLGLSLALLALLALGACQEEKQWVYGQRTKAMMQNQVLNPEAGGAEPVQGLDGVKAAKSMKDYQEGAVKSGQDQSGQSTTTPGK